MTRKTLRTKRRMGGKLGKANKSCIFDKEDMHNKTVFDLCPTTSTEENSSSDSPDLSGVSLTGHLARVDSDEWSAEQIVAPGSEARRAAGSAIPRGDIYASKGNP